MRSLTPVQKRILTVLSLVVLLLLIVLSVFGFIRKVKRNETTIADQTLITAANNGDILIQTIFTDYMMNLKNIAAMYELRGNLTDGESLALLQEVAQKNGYERLAVDYADGTTYTSDGHVFDMSAFGYLDQIERRESFITNVIAAIADGTQGISFITPLRDDGQGRPPAALRLTMSTESITNVINLSLFNGEGYYHLVDENGHYVAAGKSQNALLMDQNFFDAIAAMEYDEGFSAQDIQRTFADGSSGFTRYSVQGSKRYAYCQPAGINDWVLMTIVPQEVIDNAERQNISFATVMTVQLLSILVLVFAYLYLVQRKVRTTAVLNDQCFRALAEQTSMVIFEWNFQSGQITAMNNFKALFGRDMVTKHGAQEALRAEMVHPEDRENFQSVFDLISGGQKIENVRFRVRHANGEFHWCRLSGIVVFDHVGKPYKAIGSLEDIQSQVTNEVWMKRQSDTDQLTGIYNKAATEREIRALLSGGAQNCALLIMDLDHFKCVNDSLGHQYGDRVLVDFAEILKPHTNEHTVVGRIGGDEFFLFFGDCGDDESVLEQARKICRRFAKTYHKSGVSCTVSASIGIAFYPRDGADFDTLYKRADIALYRAKSLGKNGCVQYDVSLGDEVSSVRTEIDLPSGIGLHPLANRVEP